MSEACCTCERCDNEVWQDDLSEVSARPPRYTDPNSQYWCETCVNQSAFHCDDCGGIHSDADAISTAGGSSICISCFEDDWFTCEECCEVYHCEDMARGDYGCCCNDCGGHNGEDFRPTGFSNRSGCVTEAGSARCYGIELETDECDGYEDLQDSAAWGAKNDPTVNGKEFYSAILSGDAGLDAVREWAKLADSNGWSASDDAGYHLHIDMRNESDDSLYAIAYAYRATQEVWLTFVDRRRINGSYSRRCRWDCADVPAVADDRPFSSWARKNDRYLWINLEAYRKFTTFEIRLHEGTCDGEAVINWVKAHIRFSDWASGKGLKGVRDALSGLDAEGLFDLIAREAWQDDELRDYYAKKANNH